MSRNIAIMNQNAIATATQNMFSSGGNLILYRVFESAHIQADMLFYEANAGKAEIRPDFKMKFASPTLIPSERTIPHSAILRKNQLDRKWLFASRGYEAVTLENIQQMAGAATYLAMNAQANGRFYRKTSFLKSAHMEKLMDEKHGLEQLREVLEYESGDWYTERAYHINEEGKKVFEKNADGTWKRNVVREDNGYAHGSKHADNVLRQRFSSQLGTGREPLLYERDGVTSDDLSIANDYDDLYQDAVLGMLEHLAEHGGVDDGETFVKGSRAVKNQWRKQYTRQSVQQLVNTDENGERLPDGRFRKIRVLIESVDVSTNDRGDSFWKNVNGTLTACDEEGIDDGSIEEVVRVNWMQGFLKFALEKLPKRQAACLRVLVSKRDQLTEVPAKNGKTRQVAGATYADINKAVYNGQATQQTVSKLKRDTQKNMVKLRAIYDGTEPGRKTRKERKTPEAPAWYKGNPVDTTHGTKLNK